MLFFFHYGCVSLFAELISGGWCHAHRVRSERDLVLACSLLAVKAARVYVDWSLHGRGPLRSYFLACGWLAEDRVGRLGERVRTTDGHATAGTDANVAV